MTDYQTILEDKKYADMCKRHKEIGTEGRLEELIEMVPSQKAEVLSIHSV